MGRQSKYTTDVVQKIEQALRIGATLKLAAEYAGISEDTLIGWKKRYPDFSAKCAGACAAGAMKWLAVIDQAAPEDWRAAAWKLERRYPEEYGQRVRVDIEQRLRGLAAQYGLDPDDAVQEAQRVLEEQRPRARTG